MDTNPKGYVNIDEYIELFPTEVQSKLKELRQVIKTAAPDAEEKIGYQMPTFVLKGNLVHFAAYKNHIGFYPTPSGIEAYRDEFSIYEGSKGAIRFPIDKPLPFDLISRVVKFRVIENLKRAEQKTEQKKAKK